MTQGQDRLGRSQGRIVQTGKFVTRAVKQAKRLALVLALASVVATSALGGFGGAPAEATSIAWQGWIPGYQVADWYLYCYYNNHGFLGGTDGGIFW